MEVHLLGKLVLLIGVSLLQISAYELSNDPNDVQFLLFPDSKYLNSSDEIIYQDTESLRNSRLKPGLRTIFISHGFRSNMTSAMSQTLKNAFLQSGLNYNIFLVNWGKLSTPLPPEMTDSLYKFATYNVPVVGKRLAEFILFLQENKMVRIEDCHLLGHSLGAHLSGLAGRRIYATTKEKIPRITGLDPAGPYFYPPRPDRNLMKSNALFVDVIHTNMGVLGDTTRDGHADFYPNGGYEQPNCKEADYNNTRRLGVCSHRFAYILYADSITRTFPACPCSPFEAKYNAGLCSAKCEKKGVTFGFHIEPETNGEFYLDTSTSRGKKL